MKTSLIISALTALVAAQGIADLPACSLSCLTTAISGLGCGITDFACSCQKASELTPVVTPCVQTACSDPADQSKTIEVLAGICAAAGFPIEVPSAPSSSITPEPLPTPTDVEIQPSATGEPEYSEYPTSTATITASEYNPAPSHPTSDVPNLPSSNSDYAPIPSSVIVSRPSPKPTSVPGVLPPYPTGSAFVPAPSGTGAPTTTTTSSRLPEFTGAAVAVKAPMVAAGVLGLAAFVL